MMEERVVGNGNTSIFLLVVVLVSSRTLIPVSASFWAKNKSTIRRYEPGPPMQSNRLRWVEDGCPENIDFCGMLEFCEDVSNFPNVIFGYRHPCNDETEQLCECKAGPGPTIRLSPGKRYQLTLRNAAENVASVTNLHTHGLHIVGAGNGDDVTRHVNGGGHCLDYVWDITEDHPGGTYWYHAHHHGFTEAQVNGGAFGMLVVEDNKILNPDTPEWAANEILLMVSRINGKVYGNGNEHETIHMDANQWYRFRVGVVDPLAEPDWLQFGGSCEVHQVAADGIWRSKVPGPAKSKFYLSGSSRADFAIRCASSFHIFFGGEKAAVTYVGGVHHNPYEMKPSWTPKRPRSLQGIADAFVPPENKFDVELTRQGINNILWDPSSPLTTIAYDEVHEWTLTRSKTHPFHLHLYHVLIVQPGGCGEQHEEGEFYDTISGNEYEECKVRFKTSDIGQRCVLHCHVLSHEDNGAMGWVDVVGEDMPRNDIHSPPYSCPAPPVMEKGLLVSAPQNNRDKVKIHAVEKEEPLATNSVEKELGVKEEDIIVIPDQVVKIEIEPNEFVDCDWVASVARKIERRCGRRDVTGTKLREYCPDKCASARKLRSSGNLTFRIIDT